MGATEVRAEVEGERTERHGAGEATQTVEVQALRPRGIGEGGGREGVERPIERARLVREPSEVSSGPRIDRGEGGEGPVPDASAVVSGVCVGRVDREREPGVGEERLHVGPRRVDERPDHAVAAGRIDPGEPVDPAPSCDAGEHRLGLVVDRVSDGDVARPDPLGEARERCVARFAGGGLDRAPLDPHPQALEGHAEPRGVGCGDVELRRGGGPQTVIDAGRHESQVELGREAREDLEQRRRVGSARGADHDPRPARQEPPLGDRPSYPRHEEHRALHPTCRRRTILPSMIARLLPAALLFALTGPGFDGCEGQGAGGPVPPGTTAACFADADCASMACEDVRCIASECRVVASMRDGDLDGHAPVPCGDDCDDADSRVFPGAAELCDGRDQDCDTLVDEDAPPGAIATLLGTASDQLASAAVADVVVITDTGFSSGARLRTFDFHGHLGAAVPLTSDPIEVIDVAPTSTGGVVVVGRSVVGGTDHVVETYPIDVVASVLTVHPSSMAATLADGVQPVRIRAEPAGASFVVVWDDPADARWAWMPSWTAPVMIAATGALAPFDVASDGASVAIPIDTTVLGFFSSADGSSLGMHTFAGGLADEPVAAGPTDYLVAFHDAFDHQLAHASVAMVQPMHTAPSQGNGLPLRIDSTPLGPLVTRFDPTGARRMGIGVWALLLPDTLDAVRGDFPPSMVSAGAPGTALDFDVVSSAAGTAVLTNFGSGGSVVTVLACQPR